MTWSRDPWADMPRDLADDGSDHPIHLGSPLPRSERPLLVRPRLLDRMRSRWFTRVTVVVAPAGYGKTTLLTQTIDANRAIPLGIDCWLACRAGAGGRSATAAGLGAGLCETVGATQPPMNRANGDVIGDVVGAVSEAVWRRSPDHVALVLDDVHEIPPGSEAARLLAALVEALPANGHLVLAGRVSPPVPLARLEVEGRVARLDESDLAFTDDELAEFAVLRAVSPSRLAASGGWPALAELSASTKSDPTGLAGGYLGQEVLASLDPSRRRNLVLLAHLGPFDDELARSALDVTVDVDELVAGIPLVTIVSRGVRALHPLWRSVLVGEVDPAAVAEMRRRAAGVLIRRRQPERAVPLLIDAEAWDELGAALVVMLGAAHAVVPREVLAEWYGRLPAEARSGPYGELLAGVLAAETDPGEASDQLERSAEAFRASTNAAGEAACLAQLARLAWWSDEPERLATLAVRVLSLAADGCEEAAALACLGRALILDLHNECRQMLVELDRVLPRSLSQAWEGVVSWLRSVAFLQLGDTQQALAAAEQALARAGDLHTPLAEGARLQALWYGGRTTEALDAMPVLLEGVEAIGHRGHIAIAAAQCSVACSLVGKRDEAERYLAHARTTAVRPDAPLIDTNLSIATAALAVATGAETTARRALEACLDRHTLRQGLPAGAHLRNLALIYVLVPETRPHWDQTELGPAFHLARNLARTVAAVRDSHRLPTDTPPLPHSGIIGAHLPLPWIAELAVASADAGRADAWQLLQDTWPATRPAVVDLTARTDRLRPTAHHILASLPVPPSAHHHLRLLGPIELRRDGEPVDSPEWRRQRVRALLTYLALHRTVSRERLVEELWPEREADIQSRNLRVALTYLLRVLEPERGPRDVSFFVRQDGGNLTLHPGEWLDVDAWQLETISQQAIEADQRGAPAVVLEHGLRAAQIWQDEPNELVAEPWAVAPIDHLRRRYTTTVTRTGELLLAHGATKQALALAEKALATDPWHERAHRLAIATHQAHHDDLATRRALTRYRQAVRELGVGDEEATRMVRRLLDSVRATSS